LGKTHIFSGIARPQRFEKAAQLRCEKIFKTNFFADHHHFSSEELFELSQSGADQWGITQKDLQRISVNNRALFKKLYYLMVTLEIENSAYLHSLIASLIRGNYVQST